MTYNDVRKNENKGFSLVELIVVVAIMAVLVAVLAPSLLAYVERSRAQKDDSAMGEVTNAIMLALADQNVYDEALSYTILDSFSCYADATNNKKANAMETKAPLGKLAQQWLFTDDARLKDEEVYTLNGNMRGLTITFLPEANTKKSTFVLADGIVNYLKTNSATINGGVTGDVDFEDMTTGGSQYLYNRVRATVGDKIELTSQTYRNSAYTVFIRMGTTGGAQVSAQDAIKVYGQWCGTNLDLTDVVKSDACQIKAGVQEIPAT